MDIRTIYAVLSIAVVLLGTKGFDKVENVLAVIKQRRFSCLFFSQLRAYGLDSRGAMVDPDFPIRLDKCSLADFPHSGPRSYMLSMPMGCRNHWFDVHAPKQKGCSQVRKSHAHRTDRDLHDIHRACCLHGFLQTLE